MAGARDDRPGRRRHLGRLALLAALAAFPRAAADTAGSGSPDVSVALQEIEADIADLTALIKRQSEKAETVQGEVHRLDLEASLARRELDLATTRLEEARATSRALEARIAALEGSASGMRNTIDRILGRLYKTRIPGTLRLLLASDHPSELTATQGYLAYFARRDMERLGEYRALLEELARSRTKHDEEVARLSSLQRSVAEKSTALDGKLAERKRVLSRLKQDRTAHMRNLDDLERAAERLRAVFDGLDEKGAFEPEDGMYAVPFASLKGILPWPHPGPVVTTFGKHVNDRFKTVTVTKGIDIEGRIGDQVRAVHSGIVRWSDWFEGNGRMVIIDHGERFYTLYGHLSVVLTAKGAYVRKNQVIGRLGDTGSLEGAMLHFEIRQRATPLDPAQWLRPRARGHGRFR